MRDRAPVSLAVLIERAVAHVFAKALRGGVVRHAPILPRRRPARSRNESTEKAAPT